MNLQEFRKACNNYISKKGLIFDVTQAEDLEQIFLSGKGIAEEMTENQAELIAQSYFRGYRTAQRLVKRP